jgi:hypothetical protein
MAAMLTAAEFRRRANVLLIACFDAYACLVAAIVNAMKMSYHAGLLLRKPYKQICGSACWYDDFQSASICKIPDLEHAFWSTFQTCLLLPLHVASLQHHIKRHSAAQLNNHLAQQLRVGQR